MTTEQSSQPFEIAVGFVDVHKQPAIFGAIASLTGTPPRHIDVPGLAGPNEILEFLGSPLWWITLAVSGGFLSEMGKDGYKVTKEMIKRLRERKTIDPMPSDALARLRESLKQDMPHHDPVIFGFEVPKFGSPGRNVVGIQIAEASEYEITKAVAALALNGEAMHRELRQIADDPTVDGIGVDYDAGTGVGYAVALNDDMSIDAPLILSRGGAIERILLKFKPDGGATKEPRE